MMLTEHEPPKRVQGSPGVKTTFPVGVVAPVPEESTTTMVQVVASFMAMLLGAQLTVVDVDLRVTVTLNA